MSSAGLSRYSAGVVVKLNECLPYVVRFVVIVPRGQRVTRLIVNHYQELFNHNSGTTFMLSQISGRF